MDDEGSAHRELAAEAWRRMAEFAYSRFQRSTHLQLLRKHGLTPGHMKALAALDPERPEPMRAMADSLACDASMVTWLVDRLEERGLVERQPSPTDRRVKTVVLTDEGIELRQQLTGAMSEPPEELLGLDRRSLEGLVRELRKLPRPEWVSWPGFWSSEERAQARLQRAEAMAERAQARAQARLERAQARAQARLEGTRARVERARPRVGGAGPGTGG